MVIDASRDLAQRLCREFSQLALWASVKWDGDADPELAQRMADVANYHTLWGNVVVENGKPIGLMVDGKLVAQPVRRHWTRLAA